MLDSRKSYAFGMEMPGRKWQASNYRYSHNGQEKESELFEGANSAEYWMYDSRIGRRWELDPILKPWESGYACFGNNPILYSDFLGLDKDMPGKNDKNRKSNNGERYNNTNTEPSSIEKDGNNYWQSKTAEDGNTLVKYWPTNNPGEIHYYEIPPQKNSESTDSEITIEGGKNPPTDETKTPPQPPGKTTPPDGGTKPPGGGHKNPPGGGIFIPPPPHIPIIDPQFGKAPPLPPCNPFSTRLTFDWTLGKAKPQNLIYAYSEIAKVVKAWKPCHNTFAIFVTTCDPFANRLRKSTVDGGNLENLLFLRYMFVRDFAIRCGIPASKILQVKGTVNNNGYEHTDDGEKTKPDAHFYLR